MSSKLAEKECIPCKGGVLPLREIEIRAFLAELGGGWSWENQHQIMKLFRFKNFRQALHFTNKIGELAERQGHHPDIHLSWGKVAVIIWTHKIGGLTESDFVLAAKIDRLHEGEASR